MKKTLLHFLILCVLLVASIIMSPVAATALASDNTSDLSGQWYGEWFYDPLQYGSVFGIEINQGEEYVIIHVPEMDLIHQPLPASFNDDVITIYAGDFTLNGTASDGVIVGEILYGAFTNQQVLGKWTIYREVDVCEPETDPGICTVLPSLFTIGDVEYLTELLPFDPDTDQGYIDYPVNGETWEDQYRSYARRDLIQIVQYAAAKVECQTADWEYWNYSPIGLMDMSEADGSIPGTSTGSPGHPAGTHENGNDMDIAYYQLYAPDNYPRSIGDHSYGYMTDEYHCVSEPYMLDPWRTALFISYLSEHPHIRVIGVDGQVGLVLEEVLDKLVTLGWIDAEHRAGIPLDYEVTDTGRGWYLFHHHHIHVSMNPLYDIVSEFDIQPESLNRKNHGKFLTVYLELESSLEISEIDLSTVQLIVNGHTSIVTLADKVSVSDFNNNGIPDLTLKFDMQLVTEMIGEGLTELAITGVIDGMVFQDSDIISVIK